MKSVVKSILTVVFFSAFIIQGNAQQNSGKDLPKVIPASPEISAMLKASLLQGVEYTGAAKASVPLFEINNGSIRFPISLSYATNGIRVNDIPSRVGLGWSLIANGVISRTVRDEEDDRPGRIWLQTPDFSNLDNNQNLYNYLSMSSEKYYDTEHDIYSFSVNGLSGEFFIGTDGQPKLVHNNGVEIKKLDDENFTITSTDGIKYYFGNYGSAVEKTKSFQSNGSGTHERPVRTGWFLYKIESPEGGWIMFHYNSIEFKTLNGFYQSVFLKPVTNTSASNCPGCDAACNAFIPNVTQNKTEYYSYYLSSITTSDNTKIDFLYENRTDISGDNRLKEMIVYYTGRTNYEQVKRYLFAYDEYENSTALINKHFFLKSLKETGRDGKTLEHTFEYNNPSAFPEQTSMSQDFFGYANGANGNYNFFPRPPDASNYSQGSTGANRNPDFDFAVSGSLKKMIYPTGGNQEIFYEPHTLPVWKTDTVYTNYLRLMGNSPINTLANPEIKTGYVSTNDIPQLKLSVSVFATPGEVVPEGEPNGTKDLVRFQVISTQTGETVFDKYYRHFMSETVFLNGLIPNSTYQVKLSLYRIWAYADTYVNYSPVINAYWFNQPVSGIRVRQIRTFDNVSNKATNKFFSYRSLDNLTKSSGIGFKEPVNTQPSTQGNACSWTNVGCITNPPEYPWSFVNEDIDCSTVGNIHISSSSLTDLPLFESSPVAYSHIIESEDEYMQNGGTESYYNVFYDNIYTQMLGKPILNVPVVEDSKIPKGLLLQEKKFSKTATNNFKILRERINNYSVNSGYFASIENHMIRTRYAPFPYIGPTQNPPFLVCISPFDVAKYTYKSFWYYLDKTIEKQYSDNSPVPLITETSYEYGNSQHVQPTKINTKNSKGESIKEDLKYVADFSSTAPYQAMITKGIKSPLVQKIKQKLNPDNSLTILEKFKMNYSSFGFIEKPFSVEYISGTANPEQRLSFNHYDSKGNILEQQKTNDVIESYIWGYNGKYPVAKIMGKSNQAAVNESSIDLTVVNNPETTDQEMRTELNKLRNLSNCLVTTYTYRPLIGITSETDPNSRTKYYEYDNFNRLVLIRDQDGNILKKICYNYAGQPENCQSPCTDNTPNWQNTTTPPTCQQGPCGNTGYQLQEQKDMNLCSPSHDSIRLVTVYNPGACPLPAGMTTITYTNTSHISGFTAVYTSNTTGQQYSFSVPPAGTGVLGCLPSGRYSLTISKPGNIMLMMFGTGCWTQTGTSATFGVGVSSCNQVIIENSFE